MKAQKISWLVERPRDYFDGRDNLIKALKSLRYPFQEIGDETSCIEKDGRNHIFYGSIELGEELVKRLKINNLIVMNNTDWLDCRHYYPIYEKILLNNQYSITSVEYFLKEIFEYYGQYGVEAKIFVRPVSGNKQFTGLLLDLQDAHRFFSTFHGDLNILISRPKEIVGEWRYVVSSSAGILAQTTYMFQGLRTIIPAAPIGATALVDRVLHINNHPDPFYVIDVCQTIDGKFHLLEFNSFSHSGFYACDITKIVDNVNRYFNSL